MPVPEADLTFVLVKCYNFKHKSVSGTRETMMKMLVTMELNECNQYICFCLKFELMFTISTYLSIHLSTYLCYLQKYICM